MGEKRGRERKKIFLLGGMGNYSHLVITYNRIKSVKIVYYYAVHLKLTQYCKLTTIKKENLAREWLYVYSIYSFIQYNCFSLNCFMESY